MQNCPGRKRLEADYCAGTKEMSNLFDRFIAILAVRLLLNKIVPGRYIDVRIVYSS